MKFTKNTIPDYSRYYGNYRLAAREFSEYENVAGFLLTELNSSNTVTAKFCTCVNPKTYEVGGREIALTIESDTARIWYDGLASEFTVSDFTNADSGFGYYKITNTVSGDVWYSDLVFVNKIIVPYAFIYFTGTNASISLDGNGIIVWDENNQSDVNSESTYTHNYSSSVTEQEIILKGSITKISTDGEPFTIDLEKLIPIASVLRKINTGTGDSSNEAVVKNFNTETIANFNLSQLSLNPINSENSNNINDSLIDEITAIENLKLIGQNLNLTGGSISKLINIKTLYIDAQHSSGTFGSIVINDDEFSNLVKLESLVLKRNVGNTPFNAKIQFADLHAMPNLTNLEISDNVLAGGLQLYTPSGAEQSLPSGLNYIKITNAIETSSEVDAFINTVRASNLPDNGTLLLYYNAARTSASDEAISILTANGWSITIL